MIAMVGDATSGLDDSHLDINVELPYNINKITLPDVYIGLKINLISTDSGIVTERHSTSADRRETNDPINQIEGQISPFTHSGWLRHGCGQVSQLAGMTVCHPGESNTDYMHAEVYEREPVSGYHEKGSCTKAHDAGCIVYELFGGFDDQPGKLIRRPVYFYPIRRRVDVLNCESEAQYRQIPNKVCSRHTENDGLSIRQADRGILGNVNGTWKLTLRELKPEFIGLILEAVSFLDAHIDEFEFQVGGQRNFQVENVDVWVINPLYSGWEVQRVFTQGKAATSMMEEKDEVWRSECRPEFVRALQARAAARDGDLPIPDGVTD